MFNTVIFYIAGFKLGLLFVSYGVVDHMQYAWALYPVVLLTRGITIAALFPLLRRLGIGCSWQTAVAVWWAGLRGSISLALGLVVYHTMYSHAVWGGPDAEQEGDLLLCRDIPRDTLYIVCVVVSMTVCVNGSTVGALLHFLGLDVVADDRKFMLNAMAHKLEVSTSAVLQQLQVSEQLQQVTWPLVEQHMYRAARFDQIKDPVRAAWHEALNIERMAYLEQFEQGQARHLLVATTYHLTGCYSLLLTAL